MKRNVILINLAAAFIWMSMYAYVPTLPAYASSIGASVVMIGLIGGVYGVMQVILRIPLGFISDKFGKDKLMMVIGFSVLTASALIFVLLKGVVWILLARAMAGAAAAWWVIITASYAKYHPEEQQVKAQGVLSAAANIGKVIAALSCALAAQFFGYEATFLAALATAAIGLCLMFGLKKPQTEKIEPVSIRKQLLLFKNKDLISFSILSILSQMLCFAIPTTFTAVAAAAAGADSMQLGLLVVVFFGACGMISLFVGTKPYRKIGGIRTMAISFACGAVACIPLFYQSLPMIYLTQVLSGICYGITQASLAGFVIRCVPAVQRGAAMGIFQSLFGIGIFIGPVIAGTMIDAISFDAAYWTFAALMAASVILCYVLIPKKYDRMT